MTRKWIRRGLPGLVGVAAFGLTLWGIAWFRGAADARSPGLLPRPAPLAARTVPAHEAAPVAAAPSTPARLEPEALQRAVAEAADAAEEQVREALTRGVAEGDEPLEIRLDLYRSALEAVATESGNPEVLQYRGVWTEHFLRLPVVQSDLAALPPGDRASALASVRRRMGYAEDQVERLAQADDRREAAWQKGLAYLDDRDRLRASLEGQALEDELAGLRERAFGANAATIAREEAAGFERFERPRVYGRN